MHSSAGWTRVVTDEERNRQGLRTAGAIGSGRSPERLDAASSLPSAVLERGSLVPRLDSGICCYLCPP